MQKILFVITKSNWGGAQRYVFDLATSLPRDAWDAQVVLGGTGLPGATTGRLEEELQKNGIRTLFVPAFMRDISLLAELQAFRQLQKIFSAERPDTVHLNSSKAGGLGALAARLAGVRNIVFTVHGTPWQEDRSSFSRLLIAAASWCTFMLVHRIIVISNEAAQRISFMPLCRDKVRLVHNGIPVLDFLTKEEARTLLVPDTAPDLLLIGAVGELTWNKGYHVLLRAVQSLKRRRTDFLLCIIGEGEERAFIETMIEEEGLKDVVRLAGFVPDAHKTLKAFDLFVLPSIKEGLPYVLLEAGQAGLAVIASKVGGIPDIISERVSGLRVNPKNHNDLADKISELLDDAALRKKLADALRERAQSEFSLARMLEKTLAVYRD